MGNKKILVSISTLALITVIALSLVPSASSAPHLYLAGSENGPLAYVYNSLDGGVTAYSTGGSSASDGVMGYSNKPSTYYAGVYGVGGDGASGVYGYSYDGVGVRGSSYNDFAGYFTSSNYYGLLASGYSYAALFYGNVYVSGNIYKSGSCYFVTDHPTNQSEEIAYACLEGGEIGTYVRGSAQLIKGTATVQLPEHFSLVTSAEGLTVHITPTANCDGLYVASKSPTEVVVKELGKRKAGGSDATFDYVVNGIRIGYENFDPVKVKGLEIANRNVEVALEDPTNMREELLIPEVAGA